MKNAVSVIAGVLASLLTAAFSFWRRGRVKSAGAPVVSPEIE